MTTDNLTPEEHRQRGRDDAKTSNRFGQAAAQAAILINGGAASALLAFLSATAHQTAGEVPQFRVFVPVVLIGLLLYGVGVFLAALALPRASESIENYMLGHDRVPNASSEAYWLNADRQWRAFLLLVRGSLWVFAGSTTILAVGLFIGAVCSR